jgi:hypothetical protein
MRKMNIVCIGAASLFAAAIGCSSSGTATVLEGTWEIACTAGSGLPNQMSANVVLEFSDNNYTLKEGSFSDTACATSILSLEEEGTFTIGSAATTPAGATDINYIQSAQTATPNNGEAAVLNTGGSGSSSICTGVTFTDGTATSIAGKTCGGGSSAETSNGATILGLFLLTTTATPNTLALGEGSGSEPLGTVSPGARPTEVGSGSGNVFTKE